MQILYNTRRLKTRGYASQVDYRKSCVLPSEEDSPAKRRLFVSMIFRWIIRSHEQVVPYQLIRLPSSPKRLLQPGGRRIGRIDLEYISEPVLQSRLDDRGDR
jgi:hypothetical protein